MVPGGQVFSGYGGQFSVREGEFFPFGQRGIRGSTCTVKDPSRDSMAARARVAE